MPEDAPETFSCEISIEAEIWADRIKAPEEFCTRIITHALSGFDGPFGEIDVLLCDNIKMQELNNHWRKMNKPTNVLSFPQIGNDSILGSIALGFEICETEASMQSKSFENHVAHLLVHGVLHLLGYDHIEDQEAKEMEEAEAEILEQLGIANPYTECLEMGSVS